jgi:hypothetical protein
VGSGRRSAQLAYDVELTRMAGVLRENVEADPLQGGSVFGESATDSGMRFEAMGVESLSGALTHVA